MCKVCCKETIYKKKSICICGVCGSIHDIKDLNLVQTESEYNKKAENYQ